MSCGPDLGFCGLCGTEGEVTLQEANDYIAWTYPAKKKPENKPPVHRNKTEYTELWNAVAGAVKSAMDAHPEFIIGTPDSITKRVVGQVLALEARAAGDGG
jgi:hypothetical protein